MPCRGEDEDVFGEVGAVGVFGEVVAEVGYDGDIYR